MRQLIVITIWLAFWAVVNYKLNRYYKRIGKGYDHGK